MATTAQQFEQFMESIWDMPCEPGSDGGVIMFQHPDYDTWHDANQTAKKKFQGHFTRCQQKDGENWRTWEFPDHSRVYVNMEGSAFRLIRPRFR